MKKNILIWSLSAAASFILSAGLLAQEQVDVSVKVTKDGKVIKDTTYQFDDASEAKHAMMMMEVLSGDEEHMENIHYNYTTAHSGSGHSKAMVFISEDGETTEIKEVHGDSNVWVTEEEGDGEHVKVIKYKIDKDGDTKGKKVIVMKSDDGNTFDIMVDEDGDEIDVVKKKEIKVMVSGDEEGNWTVVEGEDGEDVEVIVITKKVDKDYDYDEDHDEDVEVKVIKKEKKQKK